MLRFSTILLAVAVTAGCYEEVTEPYDGELVRLRRATQNFTDAEKAVAAGYIDPITFCLSDPVLGGMGVHLGNPDRINATVELERPEVLLYEPVVEGFPVLVAIEYIVPFDAWTAPSPPVLMGQTFKRNEGFGVWALHVWLYRENPAGIFADWNPRVSCPVTPPGAGGAMPIHH